MSQTMRTGKALETSIREASVAELERLKRLPGSENLGSLLGSEWMVRGIFRGRLQTILGFAVLWIPPDKEAVLTITLSPAGLEFAAGLVDEILTSFPENRKLTMKSPLTPESLLFQILVDRGFKSKSVIETYRLEISLLVTRLEATCRRLREREIIPGDARTEVITVGWRKELFEFLQMEKPTLCEPFMRSAVGFAPEHSLVLVIGDKVKGVIFGEIRDGDFQTSFRVVAEELRGAVGWANLLLLHDSVVTARDVGVTYCGLEASPEDHAGTRLMAQQGKAELVSRREMLFRPACSTEDEGYVGSTESA